MPGPRCQLKTCPTGFKSVKIWGFARLYGFGFKLELLSFVQTKHQILLIIGFPIGGHKQSSPEEMEKATDGDLAIFFLFFGYLKVFAIL